MKRMAVAVLVAAAGVSVAGTAAAEKKSDGGFVLGLRAGYGLGFGSMFAEADEPGFGVIDEASLSKSVSGEIPIGLDVGYRMSPSTVVGLYAAYGIVMFKDADGTSGWNQGCPAQADCSGSDIRIGVQLQYFLSPGKSMNPWLGGGIGYESFSTTIKSPAGSESSFTLTGLEILNLQGGVDFAVADAIAVGPYLMATVGRYGLLGGVSVDGGGTEPEITEGAFHEWVMLGVRGTYSL